MLFKEIIPFLHREAYKTHKYKMHDYWLLKQVVHIAPTGLYRVNPLKPRSKEKKRHLLLGGGGRKSIK
jgi:hypothetical protein